MVGGVLGGPREEQTEDFTEEEDYVIDGEVSDETFSYGEISDSEYGYSYKIYLRIDFESKQVKIGSQASI